MVAACTHGLVDRFLFGSPDLAYIFFLFLALIVVLERPVTPSRHAEVGSAVA
jgi:hypothetical protein